MQWKKIRSTFIKDHSADKMDEEDANTTPSKGKKGATPKTPTSTSRKRPAPTSGDEAGDSAKADAADLDATATGPRKKRAPRKSKVKTNPDDSISGGGSNAQAMSYEAEAEQQPGSSDMSESNRAYFNKGEQDEATMYHGMDGDAQNYRPNGEMKMEMEMAPHEA
jgi:hypothetical protein